MAASTRASGRRTKPMERASFGTRMATSTRVIGKMTKLTVMDFTNMLMVPVILVNGVTINKMVTVSKLGLTAASTKVNTWMARSTDKECTSGSMALSILELGPITKLADLEPTDGQMAESTKANGSTITCTDRVCTHGAMEESTKVSTSMIKSMDREHTSGLMAAHTLVVGKTVNKMDKAPTNSWTAG